MSFTNTTNFIGRPAFNVEYATGSWGAAADLKALIAWNKRADRWATFSEERFEALLQECGIQESVR